MIRRIAPVALTWLCASSDARAQGFLWSPLETLTRTCDFCCYRSRSGACHGAIDFRARTPIAVFAADSGTVERVVNRFANLSNREWGYGNHIVLQHGNGYRTLYAHLTRESIAVRVDETVEAGQQIALSDNSGYSTGPHLHFEVRDPTGRRVNPYGDPPNYESGCGSNALWATCPPQLWNPLLVDSDGDGYCADGTRCLGSLMPGDCNDDNRAINPGATDWCDGLDNNCSGSADEAFEGLFTTCTIGIGGCVSSGTWVCNSEGDGLFCTAPPVGTPTPEVCDGLDNDCNEEMDEDWREIGAASLGNACTVGFGPCVNTGEMICAADETATVCSVDPLPIGTSETCNGVDDDCDGVTDDSLCVEAPDTVCIPWLAEECRFAGKLVYDTLAGDIIIFPAYNVGWISTGVTSITAFEAYEPACSPDGQRVAFIDDSRLVITSIDGTGAVEPSTPISLSRNQQVREPAWSPDGAQIVFWMDGVGCSGGGGTGCFLYVLNVEEDSTVEVGEFSYPPENPSFAPDGTRLVISQNIELVVLNLDGSDRTVIPLVGLTQAFRPEWSFTSDTIFFYGYNEGCRNGQFGCDAHWYIVSPNGENLTDLGAAELALVPVAWSPAGAWVAVPMLGGGLSYPIDRISTATWERSRGWDPATAVSTNLSWCP